jgi:4-hydroxybenzoate polyprenyltransferase
VATSSGENLKGSKKAEKILQHAAGRKFTYVGDSRADLEVWRHATTAVLVATSTSVRAAASKASTVEAECPDELKIRSYLRALRMHQWLKNLLVFVPLLVDHSYGDIRAVTDAVLAFLSFSMCASAIYVFNDLVDLSSDRRHPRKRSRPFASGAVPLLHGLLLMPVLLTIGVSIAGLLGWTFVAAIAIYIATTLLYSTLLKEYVLIDVFVLAALYTIRVIGGAAAIAVVPSFWLLAFSMAFFFSLALVKRCSELAVLRGRGQLVAHGRDYQTTDYDVLQATGVASGMAAVVIFALYIRSPDIADAYRHPEALWLLCGTITYWICRMWIKTARGEMHDDPLVYSAKDRASLLMVGFSLFAFAMAVWW